MKFNPKIVVLFGSIALLGGAVTVSLREPVETRPRGSSTANRTHIVDTADPIASSLQCDRPHINIGAVFAGQPIEHPFLLHNSSDKPVNIIDATSGADWLNVIDFPKVIQPDENGQIVVETQIDETMSGRQHATVVATVDNHPQKQVVLELVCNIQSALTASPASLTLNLRHGLTSAAVISPASGGGAIEFLDATTGLESLKVICHEIQPGTLYEVEVQAAPELAKIHGVQLRSVSLRTRGSGQSSELIPVMIVNEEHLNAEPREFSYSDFKDTCELVIRSKQHTTLGIDSVAYDGEPLSFTRTSTGRGEATIQLPPMAASAVKNNMHLIVSTSEGELLVPVRGTPRIDDKRLSKPGVGERLSVSGPTLDGSVLRERDLIGKPTVVVFWASWCGYCKKELPKIAAIRANRSESTIQYVGISLDRDSLRADETLKSLGLNWPNIFFPDKRHHGFKNPIARENGINSIPAVFVLDADGIIIAKVRAHELEDQLSRVQDSQP